MRIESLSYSSGLTWCALACRCCGERRLRAGAAMALTALALHSVPAAMSIGVAQPKAHMPNCDELMQ